MDRKQVYQLDFIGLRANEVMRGTEILVNDARRSSIVDHVSVITGKGVVRDVFLKTLDSYGIQGRIDSFNSGIVNATIE
jgi:hypothetical protein